MKLLLTILIVATVCQGCMSQRGFNRYLPVSQAAYAGCSIADAHQTYTSLNDPNLAVREGNPLALGAGTGWGVAIKMAITAGVIGIFHKISRADSPNAPAIAFVAQTTSSAVQCTVVELNRRTINDAKK